MRERGLKSVYRAGYHCHSLSRSREGAWIEMPLLLLRQGFGGVAPVRERGLKLPQRETEMQASRRSREGAWIEIKAWPTLLSTP